MRDVSPGAFSLITSNGIWIPSAAELELRKGVDMGEFSPRSFPVLRLEREIPNPPSCGI